jgi:hypothetical protein
MTKYTIKDATPTGKTDPTYGIEFIVHFNEDTREVKVSKKEPVSIGQEFNGNIVAGKYGCYFKKDPFVPGAPASTPTPSAAPAGNGSSSGSYNPDGQRQGMCFNNAANLVNAAYAEVGIAADEHDWAANIHRYASALYVLGDLKQDTDEAIDLTGVEDLFKDKAGN